MKLLLIVLLGLLAGCSNTGPALQVKVPVPVECKEQEPERPVMPTDSLGPKDSLFVKAQAAMAEIELREGYEGKLRAALRACLRPIKG